MLLPLEIIISSVLLCNLQLCSWVLSSTDNGTRMKHHFPAVINDKRDHLFMARQRNLFSYLTSMFDEKPGFDMTALC